MARTIAFLFEYPDIDIESRILQYLDIAIAFAIVR